MARREEDFEDEVESPRQTSRRRRREAGDRSAAAARALLELTPAARKTMKLGDEVQAALQRASSTRTMNARRREERRLAGVLRTVDLAQVEVLLQAQAQTGREDARTFQRAEVWRARLIEEGRPAIGLLCSEVGGMDAGHLEQLVNDAQAERDRGFPKGAAKILFRYIMSALLVSDRGCLRSSAFDSSCSKHPI